MIVPLFPSWPLAAAPADVWSARARADIRRLRAVAADNERAGRHDEARARRRLAGELVAIHGEPSLHHAADLPRLQYILDEAFAWRRRERRVHAHSDHDREAADHEVFRSLADRVAILAEIAAVERMRAA